MRVVDGVLCEVAVQVKSASAVQIKRGQKFPSDRKDVAPPAEEQLVQLVGLADGVGQLLQYTHQGTLLETIRCVNVAHLCEPANMRALPCACPCALHTRGAQAVQPSDKKPESLPALWSCQ